VHREFEQQQEDMTRIAAHTEKDNSFANQPSVAKFQRRL
jgi:hypothetical protein